MLATLALVGLAACGGETSETVDGTPGALKLEDAEAADSAVYRVDLDLSATAVPLAPGKAAVVVVVQVLIPMTAWQTQLDIELPVAADIEGIEVDCVDDGSSQICRTAPVDIRGASDETQRYEFTVSAEPGSQITVSVESFDNGLDVEPNPSNNVVDLTIA